MGSIGLPEVLVVLVVALLVLGPARLPEAARSLGKAMHEFRRVSSGLQAEVRDAFGDLERSFNEGADTPQPKAYAPWEPPSPPDEPSSQG